MDFDAKEGEAVPRVVQNAFRVVFRYLQELKQVVDIEGSLEDILAEKAEIRDVYNSLQLKADTKVVKDVSVRWGERMEDVENRVGNLTQILEKYTQSVDDRSDFSQVATLVTSNSNEIESMKASIEFLSSELAQDRDTWSDLQYRIDDLVANSNGTRPHPRRAVNTVRSNARPDETNLSISTLTPVR